MQTPITSGRENLHRSPWNKGKLTGSKPPLRTKNVWSIWTKLQVERRIRDLAMFNLAIDSKLRGYDVVSLTVEDVAPKGAATDRTTVRQKKTGHPVRFELSEQTREAVEAYIRAAHKKAGEFLFTSRRYAGRSLTTRQYARLVSGWTAGLAWIQQCMALTRSAVPRPHSSIARPATYVPSKIKSTVRYLGIEVDDALAIAEQVDV